jgi:hypothetical protein
MSVSNVTKAVNIIKFHKVLNNFLNIEKANNKNFNYDLKKFNGSTMEYIIKKYRDSIDSELQR